MSRRSGTPRHPTAKVKGGWSPEEDALLASLVKQFGEGHWSPIARALNEATGKSDLTGRIGKQCRERWNHHLSPGLRKGPWTSEEEVMVVDAHKRLGNRWSDIARCIPGRSENAVKNHWNATLRKRVTPDNPAGPLKEYLDSLKLTVAPRRRNGGGNGAGSSGAGTKRKRAARDRDNSTSSEESDEGTDEEADAESPPDSEETTPSRGRTAAGAAGGTSGANRPTGHQVAAAAATTAAGCASGGAFATAAGTAAAALGSDAHAVAGGVHKGTPPARRFPSDGGGGAIAAAAAGCTTAYGGVATSGDTAPEAAAAATDAARRPRSKRVAALVGNERLRNMVEAEKREMAAEAAAEAQANIGAEAEAVLDMDAVDFDGDCRAAEGSDDESMDMTTGIEAEAGQFVDGVGADPSLATEAAQLRDRPSRTESICESDSGLPHQVHLAFAGPAVAPGAEAARDGAAMLPTGASGPPAVSPFTHGASCAAIAGAGLPCQALHAASTAEAAAGGGVGAVGAAPGSPAAPAPLQQQLSAAPAGRAAPWPPLTHNWSTNNMQMLEAEQLSRRPSYGAGAGGKVRPAGCSGAACASLALYGGGSVPHSAATAATVGSFQDVSMAPAAAPSPPPATTGRACLEDEDLLLDTVVDFSGTLCLRHVASGSALFDYDAPPAPDMNAVTVPQSPAVTAAPFASPAPPPPPPPFLQQQQHMTPHVPALSNPAAPPTWPKLTQLAAPGRNWTPPDLFDEPHLDFGNPDSPLHAGAHVTVPEAATAGTAAAGAGAHQGLAVGGAAGGAGGSGSSEMAAAAAAAVGMSMEGGAGTYGAARMLAHGIGCGVAANSSITSVGSPLSELYEHGDSGGGPTGAARQPDGWTTAVAATAAAGGGAAPAFADASDGLAAYSPTSAGVVVKRESSFSGCSFIALSQPQPSTTQAVPIASSHPMAPFKAISAPPPSATGAQPSSPWTPVGTAPTTAAVPPQTIPTAPASPHPWGMPLASGPSGGTMPLSYVIGAGPPPAPPQMPHLTASSGLPPPVVCYGVPPPPPHLPPPHLLPPHLLPPHPHAMMHQAMAPPPPSGVHALYGGTPLVHAGHPPPGYHHHHAIMAPPPPYAVMHTGHSAPPPPLSAGQLDQAYQAVRQHQQAEQQPGACSDPLQQQQQPQPPNGVLYYVGNGYYYYQPGLYTPYFGVYNTAPYPAAGGHPPLPMPMPTQPQEQPLFPHQPQQQPSALQHQPMALPLQQHQPQQQQQLQGTEACEQSYSPSGAAEDGAPVASNVASELAAAAAALEAV